MKRIFVNWWYVFLTVLYLLFVCILPVYFVSVLLVYFVCVLLVYFVCFLLVSPGMLVSFVIVRVHVCGVYVSLFKFVCVLCVLLVSVSLSVCFCLRVGVCGVPLCSNQGQRQHSRCFWRDFPGSLTPSFDVKAKWSQRNRRTNVFVVLPGWLVLTFFYYFHFLHLRVRECMTSPEVSGWCRLLRRVIYSIPPWDASALQKHVFQRGIWSGSGAEAEWKWWLSDALSSPLELKCQEIVFFVWGQAILVLLSPW